MSTESLKAKDQRYILPHYVNIAKRQAEGADVIDHGDRVYVLDEDGKKFLDASSGMWAASLGFNEIGPAEAAIEQLRKMPFYHYGLNKTHEPAIRLAEKLCSMVPLPDAKVHFATTGSEANDFLIKFIWFRNNARGLPQKTKVLSHTNAWHGSTIAACSMSGISRCHQGYNLPLPGFLHLTEPHYFRNHHDGESEADFVDRLCCELEERIAAEGADTIAAMIAEPVGGASGVVMAPDGYYARIQEILKRNDILFIADEVITGFGRTGKMFGSEIMGIKPDAMTFAKGFSSSYIPISAIVMGKELYDGIALGNEKFGFFAHGSTFAGHPVGCAAALRTLEIIEERNLLEHICESGEYLGEKMRRYESHPLVGEIRGTGLMWALEMVADKESRRLLKYTGASANRLAVNCEKKGLILRNLANGDSVALAPPLIINKQEIDDIFDRFDSAFQSTIEWIEEKNFA